MKSMESSKKIKESLNQQQRNSSLIKASELREHALLLGGLYVNVTSFLELDSFHMISESD